MEDLIMPRTKKYFEEKKEEISLENILENDEEVGEEKVGEVKEELAEEEQSELEMRVESGVKYQWDGVLREGLFKEVLRANLDEKEEEMWVKKFAELGLAFRTILGPPRTDAEVIIKAGMNPEATYRQYLSFKEHLKEKGNAK